MENVNMRKKELQALISETLLKALETLPLPEISKKGRKQLTRNSKKLAVIYRDQVKRAEKKKKHADQMVAENNSAPVKVPAKAKVKSKMTEEPKG